MSEVKVGDRVGAISHGDGEKVYIYGYGEYLGELEQPDGTRGVFGVVSRTEVEKEVRKLMEEPHVILDEERLQKAVSSILKNPCIKLDNGEIIWGSQCWWGAEDEIKEKVAGRETIFISVADKLKP